MLLVDYDKCQPSLADKKEVQIISKPIDAKKRNLKQIALFYKLARPRGIEPRLPP